jgi:hypothetical protein
LAGMVLTYSPGVVEVTLTRITQFGLGATVALFRVTEVPPGLAVRDAEGPQSCKAFAGSGGSAITTFAGKLSVRVVPVRGSTGLLLLIVIVRTLTSPTHIVLGENDLFMEGGGTEITVKVALAGVVFVIETPPPVELNSSAGMVLIRLPTVLEVTSIATVHSPGFVPLWAGTVPPLNDRVVVPESAVTVPPQVFEMFAGFAIDKPGCTPTRLSVHVALFKAKEFGL